MPLSSSVSRAVFAGDGTATSFPFNFKVWQSSDLTVSVEDNHGVTSIVTGWSVSLSDGGGSVIYLHNGAPLPAGFHLAILRNMPFSQEISLISGVRFDPAVIETALDQAAAERQQLREALSRAVKIPETGGDDPAQLIQSIYTARSDAQAAATAAAASEANAADFETEAAASAGLAQLWAESDTAPGGTGTKSAKAWAEEAARHSVVMTGATAEAAGLAGLVPAPAAGDQGALLTGGGFYQSFSASPAAGVVPQAGADGRLAVGWIPGVFTGDIRFLPFRADALPYGWYSMNGELYTVNSAPGAALLALPETFRTDWGIAVSGDGATVNVPDWFATDGRGPVMRAVDGTDRQVGTIEQDAAYELDFPVGYRNGGIDDYSGLYPPLYNRVDSSQRIAGIFTGNATKTAPVTWFKMSLVENTATEIRILNRGMTPAIFLGA